MSLNVAGLTNLIKRKRVAKYLKKERASLIFLQETHLKETETRLWQRKIYHAAVSSRSCGVMLGMAANFPWVLLHKIIYKKGRDVILKGKVNSCSVTIVGVYAPNNQQAPLGDEIFGEFEQNRHDEIIMVRNFSAFFDNKIDHSKDSLIPVFPSNFHHYIESIWLVQDTLRDHDYTFLQCITLPTL